MNNHTNLVNLFKNSKDITCMQNLKYFVTFIISRKTSTIVRLNKLKGFLLHESTTHLNF